MRFLLFVVNYIHDTFQSTVFITFKVAPSSHFRRDKYDVHCDVEISIAQAILGGTVKVFVFFFRNIVTLICEISRGKEKKK